MVTIPNRTQLARLAGNDQDMLRLLERIFILTTEITPEQVSVLNATTESNAIAISAIQTAIGGLDGGNIVFVAGLSDLPPGPAIQLADNVTYFLTALIDLQGGHIVGGQNSAIIGGSSENCGLTSTGLTGALVRSQWSLPMRHVRLEAAEVLDLNATANPGQALDWYGVNIADTSNAGLIQGYENVIASNIGFLSASGLVIAGDSSTVAFDNCLFSGSATGTVITMDATISRRFRVIYSSFVVPAGAVGIDVTGSVPDEGYILDTVNFSGAGTYVATLDGTSNKALFVNCVGVPNTLAVSSYFMVGNTTATTITAADIPAKVSGTTTSSAITQKFLNTNNRATYTGAVNLVARVGVSITLIGAVNETFSTYIAKNGVIVPESGSPADSGLSGRLESTYSHAVLEIAPGDYIEIFVENQSSAADITVEDMNVIIL